MSKNFHSIFDKRRLRLFCNQIGRYTEQEKNSFQSESSFDANPLKNRISISEFKIHVKSLHLPHPL